MEGAAEFLAAPFYQSPVSGEKQWRQCFLFSTSRIINNRLGLLHLLSGVIQNWRKYPACLFSMNFDGLPSESFIRFHLRNEASRAL